MIMLHNTCLLSLLHYIHTGGGRSLFNGHTHTHIMGMVASCYFELFAQRITFAISTYTPSIMLLVACLCGHNSSHRGNWRVNTIQLALWGPVSNSWKCKLA